MSHQFVYTSVPSGLKPGSQGYCMVAATQGLPQNLASQFEKLSGYKHLFKPNDRKNPVGYGHVVIRVSGTFYHVVSRVADAGLDYTNRSNLIAHHVALQAQAAEQPEGGPAWLLDPQQGKFFTEWSGDPRQLPDFPAASGGDRAGVCRAWQAASGHAGWGGVVAETALSTVPGKVAIIYPAGLDMLPLLRESMALLPPSIRWRVTFNTYFTQLLPGQECHWRCIPAGTPQAKNLRGMTVIDLSAGQPPPAGIGKQAGEQGTPLESAPSKVAPSGPHTVGPRSSGRAAAPVGAAVAKSADPRLDPTVPPMAPTSASGVAPSKPPPRQGRGRDDLWSAEEAGDSGVDLRSRPGKKASKKKSSSHLMLTFYVLLFCILPITAAGVILAWRPIKEVVLGHDDSKDTGQQNQEQQNQDEQNQDEQNENQQDENQQNQNQQSNDSSDAGQQDRSNNNGAGDVVEVRLTSLEKSDGVLDLNNNAAAGETPHWTVTLDEDTDAALILKLDPPDFGNIEVKPELPDDSEVVTVSLKLNQLEIQPSANFFTRGDGLRYRIEHDGILIAHLTIVVNGEGDPLVIEKFPKSKEYAEVKSEWNYSVEATDPDNPDNQTFKFAFDQSPKGMEIEPSTGKISWTPQWSDLGSQQVTVAVSRKENSETGQAGKPDTQSTEKTFTIKVDAPNNLGITKENINVNELKKNNEETPLFDFSSVLKKQGVEISFVPDLPKQFKLQPLRNSYDLEEAYKSDQPKVIQKWVMEKSDTEIFSFSRKVTQTSDALFIELGDDKKSIGPVFGGRYLIIKPEPTLPAANASPDRSGGKTNYAKIELKTTPIDIKMIKIQVQRGQETNIKIDEKIGAFKSWKVEFPTGHAFERPFDNGSKKAKGKIYAETPERLDDEQWKSDLWIHTWRDGKLPETKIHIKVQIIWKMIENKIVCSLINFSVVNPSGWGITVKGTNDLIKTIEAKANDLVDQQRNEEVKIFKFDQELHSLKDQQKRNKKIEIQQSKSRVAKLKSEIEGVKAFHELKTKIIENAVKIKYHVKATYQTDVGSLEVYLK